MNNSVQWRIKKPSNKGGRWVATRIQTTDVGLIRVHGSGGSSRDAIADAGEKHSKELTRRRMRLSRPNQQFYD